MLCSSVFIIYSVSGLFVPFAKDPSVLTREVSSEYVISLKKVLTCEKSLIYIMNNRGPSIEPCGTPVFISTPVLPEAAQKIRHCTGDHDMDLLRNHWKHPNFFDRSVVWPRRSGGETAARSLCEGRIQNHWERVAIHRVYLPCSLRA